MSCRPYSRPYRDYSTTIVRIGSEGSVMATILHMSFRVKEPQRSAALYAELLDGDLIDPGPQLSSINVKSIAFGKGLRG